VGRNRISFRHTDIWDRLIDDLLDLNRRYSDVYRCAHHHAILVDCLAGNDGRHLHHAALITYFDEVKYHKGRQPYYWLGGITVDAELIKTLEEQLNSLAAEVFGVRTLSRETEFHAADIMNGHEQFEGWKWEKKLGLLKRLISIFGAAERMGKVYVRIEPARMVGSDVEGTAFMYFIERVDSYLRAQNTPGLLIGDRESESILGKFAESLSRYRASRYAIPVREDTDAPGGHGSLYPFSPESNVAARRHARVASTAVQRWG
jgi:hypothetical protein